MNDEAAHLVDRVVPDVPIRQWVLSLPSALLRIPCAFRPEALTRTLHAFVQAVFAFQRRRARNRGLGVGRCGKITVVQRFGSACALNLHFHTEDFDGDAEWRAWPSGRATARDEKVSAGTCSGRRCPMSGLRGSTTAVWSWR